MQVAQNDTSYGCSYPTFKAGIKLDDINTERAFKYIKYFDNVRGTNWCKRLVDDLKNIPCEDLLQFKLHEHDPFNIEITVTNTANNWASGLTRRLNEDHTFSYIDNNTSKVILETEKYKDKLSEAFYNYIKENKNYFFRNLPSTSNNTKLNIQA